MSKSFVLAYCNENHNIAKKMEDDLGKAGIRFEHLACDSTNNGNLSKAIIKSKKTVFLLISDNFLKSTSCMHDALHMLNTCLAQKRIQPIIIDGEFYNKNTSSFQQFPTEFRRISDLIKYMNHWQEHYLKMRKNKANISEKQEAEFNKELKRVRTISAEVGEYLRVLRETEFWEMDDLRENYYEWFFDRIGKQDLLVKYKSMYIAGSLEKNEQAIEIEDEVVSETSLPISSNTPKDPEISTEQTELEKKKQATYDIIADIFDDDEEDDQNDTKSGIHIEPVIKEPEQPIDFEDMENVTTWNEIITDKEPMNFDDKSDFFNKIAHLIEKDEDHLAVKQLDLYLEQYPEDANAYVWLGRIANNEEDFLLGKKCYEKAIKINNQDPQILTEYGQLVFHHFKDEPKKASKAFKKALSLNENIVDANYFYALLLTEVLEKPKKAIPFFEKTLQLNPTHAFANYDLAFLYFNKKNKTKAAQHYEYAFTINPELRVPENDKAFWYNEYLEQKDQTPKETIPMVKDFTKPELEEDLDNTDVETETEVPAPEKPQAKTVLITGATSGIGKATADIFAENGCRIIITGRREDRLDEMKSHYIEKFGVDIHTLVFDVRDWEETQKNVDSLPEEWQEIDLLINNAGLAKGYAPVHEGNLSHWDAMIDTNIKGLLYMTRLITPGMVSRKQGQIINICSSAGHEVYPNGNVYCATKHAVDALTKGLRLELYNHGIRVSQISPGHVEETEFAAVRFDGDLERAAIYNDFQPLKSSDVADAIYYMASRPPHVTIQDLILMGTQQASNIFIDRSGRK